MGLLDDLRRVTAASHARLESELDLMAEPLDRARFVRALERFWGFHRAWEPAAAEAVDAELFTPRRKLHRLEADLDRLGVGAAARASLPVCAEAAGLVRGPGALGSVYVFEGATLGGQVISRALAGAPWAPPGGLGYFAPYGERTGAMWRAFRDHAEARDTPETRPAVLAAAVATFEALTAWMMRD